MADQIWTPNLSHTLKRAADIEDAGLPASICEAAASELRRLHKMTKRTQKRASTDHAAAVERFQQDLVDVVLKHNGKIMISAALGALEILKHQMLTSAIEGEDEE